MDNASYKAGQQDARREFYTMLPAYWDRRGLAMKAAIEDFIYDDEFGIGEPES